MKIHTQFKVSQPNFDTATVNVEGIGQKAAGKALDIAGKGGKTVLTGFVIDGKFKKVVLESHWKRTLVKK